MPKTPQIGEIEVEVRKVYGIKPKDGESYESYVKRIGKAMDEDEGDKKWESLGDAAQEFLVKLSNANRKGTDLPAFPGPEGDEEDDTEEADNDAEAEAESEEGGEQSEGEGEDEDAEPKGKKKATMSKKTSKTAVAKTSKKPVKGEKGAPAKGDKTTDKKKVAAKDKDKPAKKKGKPATTRILELVYEKPDRSSAKVEEILKKEGYHATIATVTTYRIDFLRYLRFLKTKGIKGLPDLPE